MNKPAFVDRPADLGWHDANVVVEHNTRESSWPNLNPLQHLILWFRAVDAYHLADRGGVPTEEERRLQKRMLSILIDTGEWLVSQLRLNDVTARVDVSLADVEATLEALYVSVRVSFGGMTEARRKQVLKEVFGGA